MSEKKLMLPYGIENFEDMRRKAFYYVDKTGMIKDLLENPAIVTLFTRPRRFGKSLNMSMLQYFFEIGSTPSLFDGLAISKETEICEEYMGKYPVISITLKGVDGMDFEGAKRGLWRTIEFEASRFDCLQESGTLNDRDKEAMFNLSKGIGDLESSLALMSKILYEEYGKKTIILIDEYDVPLNMAQQGGYYDEMIKLIRNFLGSALKTNNYLEFAVLTGCLRVAKESIFTGMNNLRVCSVLDNAFDEWFGFTEDEVCEMLEYYGKGDYIDVTKEWYDGYRFGDAEIYCPWDVVCWCSALRSESNPEPEDFWANSSGNDIINKFADMASEEEDGIARDEMSELLEGKPVTKKIKKELTYSELYSSIDNVWSMFLNTGYLTPQGKSGGGTYDLVIPNKEITELFREMLDEWFEKKVRAQAKEGKYAGLYSALENGDAETAEKVIRRCLKESISYMDAGYNPEASYHNLLNGILMCCKDWDLKSNREAGDGRADTILVDEDKGIGIVVEVKRTESMKDLEKAAQDGLAQIEEMKYAEYFDKNKFKTVRKYCIAFCKKECRVRM